jgi:hypothetical protein
MLGGLLCVMVFAILIGTLIGAVFLRAAIAMYNAMAGGRKSLSSVPEPDFGKAMGITFVTMLVNAVVSFGIGFVIGTGAQEIGQGGREPDLVAAAQATGQARRGLDLVASAISFPISLLVMAAMLSGMLPTTFGRAILVTLCYMLIVLLVVGVVFAFFLALGFSLSKFAV